MFLSACQIGNSPWEFLNCYMLFGRSSFTLSMNETLLLKILASLDASSFSTETPALSNLWAEDTELLLRFQHTSMKLTDLFHK